MTPSGQQRDALRYAMEDADESSSENNVIVSRIVNFSRSPHQMNKTVYEFTLTKYSSSNFYRSRIGFGLSLSIGYCTIVAEYFPLKMTNVNMTAQATTISINSETNQNVYSYRYNSCFHKDDCPILLVE